MRTISIFFFASILLFTYAQTSIDLPISAQSVDSQPLLDESDLACFYYPRSPRCRELVSDYSKSVIQQSTDPDGPRCLLIEPTEEVVTVPTFLQLSFVSEDSEVDLSSVSVKISKKFLNAFLPPLDVTNRVRPYMSSKGISWKNATLPKGEYQITLHMRDFAGRASKTVFSIKTKG